LEFVDIQEEYIKDEMKNLKRELIRCVGRGEGGEGNGIGVGREGRNKGEWKRYRGGGGSGEEERNEKGKEEGKLGWMCVYVWRGGVYVCVGVNVVCRCVDV